MTVEEFFEPITPKLICGENARYDPLYDQIRHARVEDESYLPQGIWKRDLKVAEWETVASLSSQILKSKSKDLHVAAWLTESWYHLEGLKGLTKGVKLMHGLCEKFWSSLYPQIENGDVEYRMAPIDWVNQKLSNQLGLFKVTSPREDKVQAYTFAEYEFLYKNKKIAEKQSHLNLTALKESIKNTPDSFYTVMLQDCHEAIDALESFENFLMANAPKSHVSFYQLRSVLGQCRDFCMTILTERKSKEEVSKKEVIEMKPKESKKTSCDQPLKSREQAYALLEQIAIYLQTIEPHSPTPYLLKKAIAWGDMPLSQLLHEFIENNMDFKQLQRWLGIPSSHQESAKDIANPK